jgi:hypothetical protein
LLVVSVRRRAPAREQMLAIREHLAKGRPLVGIRTASHAFSLRDAGKNASAAEWPEFDAEVLGGNYQGHYPAGPLTTLAPAAAAKKHRILDGIEVQGFVSRGSLYRTSPLAIDCEPILLGSIPGQSAEPVAWLHRFGPGNARVFYTSLGHPEDFAGNRFRRLLLNGICWGLDVATPVANPASR